MFQAKVVEDSKTHINMFRNLFSENCAACDIMCENVVTDGQATDDSIIRSMRFACWLSKAIDIHPEYCYAYCFSTTTMVKQSRLILPYKTVPVLLVITVRITASRASKLL
jgi:hypothetical protein